MDKYNSSELFKLIGHQPALAMLGEQGREALEEIMNGNSVGITPENIMCCVDVFAYGYIMGKRAERAARKEKELK